MLRRRRSDRKKPNRFQKIYRLPNAQVPEPKCVYAIVFIPGIRIGSKLIGTFFLLPDYKPHGVRYGLHDNRRGKRTSDGDSRHARDDHATGIVVVVDQRIRRKKYHAFLPY